MKNNLSINNFIIYSIYFFPISILIGPFFVNLNLILCSLLFVVFFIANKKIKSFLSPELILLFSFILYNIVSDLILERPNSFKSLSLLRFFLFGLCVNFYFSNNLINTLKYQKYLLFIIFLVCIDASIQYFFGVNIVGIKKEPNYVSSFFGDEKILGSYISKIIIFSLPFLINKINLKKTFLLFFILFIILQTTERTGLFIFLVSILTFLFFSNYTLKRKIIVFLISFSILSMSLIFHEKLRVNYIYKTFHQFGFENLNKKIILLVNDKKIFSACEKVKITKTLCVEQRYENLKKQLGLHDLKRHKNIGIFSQNHIAHILVGIKIWQNSKFFGIGVSNFRHASWSDEYQLENELLNNIKASTHPHNLYIQILTETGLIGFILFFLSIVIIIFKKIKNFVNKKENFEKYFAFFVILIIFLLPIPTGNIFGTSHGIFFWTYLLMNINLNKVK